MPSRHVGLSIGPAEEDPGDTPYVQATLSDHDDIATAALTCRKPQLDSIRLWQRDLADYRDRAALPPLLADVTTYRATEDDDMVTVTADVAVTMIVDGKAHERLTRPYTFTLTREQGWKVCTAQTNN